MSLEIYKHRSGLPRLMKALGKGSVTLGFIGGSISEPTTGNRWPEFIIRWFIENYPKVRFYVENAAIGATGSDLGVFRAKCDLIDRGCDIVFIEYAVNDSHIASERRMRSREGLIRKLLAEERDIVITYTFMQEMYSDMVNGIVPDTISEFEELAEFYGIGSIWMGLYALEDLKKGRMKWEEWLPDGLHPEYRGSLCYAQSVINYLEKELNEKRNIRVIPSAESLPSPLNNRNWEKTKLIPFCDVKLEGPWSIRRYVLTGWIDQILYTSSVGACIAFNFEGRGLALGFEFGKNSSEFRYRLDGAGWIDVTRDRPWWVGEQGLFRIDVIADDLEFEVHSIEVEVIHGNREECKGTNFSLAFIGVIE